MSLAIHENVESKSMLFKYKMNNWFEISILLSWFIYLSISREIIVIWWIEVPKINIQKIWKYTKVCAKISFVELPMSLTYLKDLSIL